VAASAFIGIDVPFIDVHPIGIGGPLRLADDVGEEELQGLQVASDRHVGERIDGPVEFLLADAFQQRRAKRGDLAAKRVAGPAWVAGGESPVGVAVLVRLRLGGGGLFGVHLCLLSR
jgi:hypothetical protein